MRVVSISGASGAGKTTLQEKLIECCDYARVLSHTTRPRRITDREGEYHYSSVSDFFRLKDSLWSVEIHGNHYSTQRSDLCKAAAQGNGAVIVMSVDCLLHLNKFCFAQDIQHIAIHLLSPSKMILRERMISRGDDCGDVDRRVHECSAWDDLARTMKFIRLVPPMSQLETFDHVMTIIG
ncbi:MAG TPA: hypothetical protein PKA42_01590 [Candidatus Paceibacterota bacterium]|nr:hypothetical protein [Candidatus Paceibacterota bacterium]HMO82837.1 hypothetical protein [Candidatus Paceibacterota bacterium]